MALDEKDIGTDILNTDDSDIPTDFMEVFCLLVARMVKVSVFFFQYKHGQNKWGVELSNDTSESSAEHSIYSCWTVFLLLMEADSAEIRHGRWCN